MTSTTTGVFRAACLVAGMTVALFSQSAGAAIVYEELPGRMTEQTVSFNTFEDVFNPKWRGGGPVIGQPQQKPKPRTIVVAEKNEFGDPPLQFTLPGTMKLLSIEREVSTRARALYDVRGRRYYGESWLTRHTSDVWYSDFKDKLARQTQVRTPGGAPAVMTRSYADIDTDLDGFDFDFAGRVQAMSKAPSGAKHSIGAATSRSVVNARYKVDGPMETHIVGHVAATKDARVVFRIYDEKKDRLVYKAVSRKGERLDFDLEGRLLGKRVYRFTVEAVSKYQRKQSDMLLTGGIAEYAVTMDARVPLGYPYIPSGGDTITHFANGGQMLGGFEMVSLLQAVPEPSGLALLTIAGVVLVRRRRGC